MNTHWHLKIKINQSVHSLFDSHIKPSNQFDSLTKDPVYFLAKRGRRPRVAGFIILSLKGLRRDEISCGVYGHVYLFIYLSVRLVCAGNDVTRPRAGGLMV